MVETGTSPPQGRVPTGRTLVINDIALAVLGVTSTVTGVAVYLAHRRISMMMKAQMAMTALTKDKLRPQCSRQKCRHGAYDPCKGGMCAACCSQHCGAGVTPGCR